MTENEQKYFEKLLDAKFLNIEGKLDNVIKLQTIANGRVTKLENWRASSQGVWKATSIIGSIIGALLGLLITTWFKS